MKKHIATIITGSRIVFGLTLLFLPLSSAWFYVFYLLCGLSDMVDGTVATELNGKISVSSGIVVLAVDERIENINVKITDKIIKTEKISVPFPAREAYSVTFDNGVTVKTVDFASAGWDFGHEKGLVSVWLDKE